MVIRTPTMLTRLFGYFFGILVLVLLPMVIDNFNICARACTLSIIAQIKIMEETSLVFSGLWFGIYLLPLEKVQDCVMEEERV
jgi:hypothetical protein